MGGSQRFEVRDFPCLERGLIAQNFPYGALIFPKAEGAGGVEEEAARRNRLQSLAKDANLSLGVALDRCWMETAGILLPFGEEGLPGTGRIDKAE